MNIKILKKIPETKKMRKKKIKHSNLFFKLKKKKVLYVKSKKFKKKTLNIKMSYLLKKFFKISMFNFGLY